MTLEILGRTAQNHYSKVSKFFPSFNLWMNWEKLCPNLILNIENKMGIYTRLATFQAFLKF